MIQTPQIDFREIAKYKMTPEKWIIQPAYSIRMPRKVKMIPRKVEMINHFLKSTFFFIHTYKKGQFMELCPILPILCILVIK